MPRKPSPPTNRTTMIRFIKSIIEHTDNHIKILVKEKKKYKRMLADYERNYFPNQKPDDG